MPSASATSPASSSSVRTIARPPAVSPVARASLLGAAGRVPHGGEHGRRLRRELGLSSCRACDPEALEHVLGPGQRHRAEAEEGVRAARELVISPGTANTSRPSSSAKSAVISAARSRHDDGSLTEPGDDPVSGQATAGSTPGGYSETIIRRDLASQSRCAAG